MSVIGGEPYAIHVAVGHELAARFVAGARTAGMGVFQLDLTGLRSPDELADYLAAAFMFPQPTQGLDAAISLISDLEWFGNENGYLVVVHGLDQAPEVVESFVQILPTIVDRRRSQAVPFVVALLATDDRIPAALDAANRWMQHAGELPWAQPGTGAVEVVLHNRGDPVSDP